LTTSVDREGFLDGLLERLDVGVLGAAQDGRVLAHNSAFAEMFGLESTWVAGAEEAHVMARIARYAEDAESFQRPLLGDHDEHVDIVALRDGRRIERRTAPCPGGRVWVFRDITSQLRAASEGEDAVDRLAEIAHAGRIGGWRYDVATDRMMLSTEARRVVGAPRVVSLAEALTLHHPDDRDHVQAAVRRGLERGERFMFVARSRTPGGQERVLETQGRAERDKDGNVVALVGTTRDITRQHRAEEKASRAIALLEHFVDNMPVAVAQIDADGRIIRANEAFANEFVISAADPADLSLWELFPVPTSDRLRVREAIIEGRSITAVWPFTRGGRDWSAEIHLVPVPDGEGHAALYVTDPRGERSQRDRAAYRGLLDALTGLPLFAGARRRLAEAIERGPVAVIHFELTNQRAINAAHGRDLGDEVVMVAAHRLHRGVPDDALVARHTGNDFVVVVPGIGSEQEALALADRLRAQVSAPLQVGETSIHPRVSAGVTVLSRHDVPETARDLSDLALREAEVATESARRSSAASARLITSEQRRNLHDEIRLVHELERALERGEGLELVYQPVVTLATGELAGLETLIRWRHPELGDVSPARFIPLAERSQLIIDVGRFVAAEACRHIRRWRDAGHTSLLVSLNVSGPELEQSGYARRLLRTVSDAGVPPQQIVVEITETALQEITDQAAATLEELRAHGFSLYLDDFGTGASSLAHLRDFPGHGLKIDGSFIRDTLENSEARAIVDAVVAMAGAIGAPVVAEGIETSDHARYLVERGVTYGQGWLISRPLAAAHVPDMLATGLERPLLDELAGETITLGEAARMLQVSPSTVRRWADAGLLRSERTEGGHRRVRRADVLRRAPRPRAELRAASPPRGPLEHAGRVLLAEPRWVLQVALRALYVSDDRGWFGTTVGSGAAERWLRALGNAAMAGRWDDAVQATENLNRLAATELVPLVERASLIDASVQALRLWMLEHQAPAEEARELGRLGTMLRRVVLDGVDS